MADPRGDKDGTNAQTPSKSGSKQASGRQANAKGGTRPQPPEAAQPGQTTVRTQVSSEQSSGSTTSGQLMSSSTSLAAAAPGSARATADQSPTSPPSAPPSPQADPLLLEVAWEACNQVGGIYTVLRSKAPTMVGRWANRYSLVGPYMHDTAQVEFEAASPVGPVGNAVEAMNAMGYRAHFGRWLVSGRPHVVLLELDAFFPKLDEIKYRLWVNHHIPSIHDELFHNVLAFGEAVRLFASILGEREGSKRKIIGHFHEWMGGAAIPMLRRENWPGSLTFTTHATLLGRYLATHNPMFYDHLSFFDSDHEAAQFNIQPQHNLERAAAHGCHVFTTVSEVTAQECRYLLGRRPDKLLPNGLNIERFAAVHEFQNLHNLYKQNLHEFTIGHFFPSYSFDLDNTLYLFTSGRYEFHNKGIDLTIEALARLNWRLKQAGTPLTLVFFIVTRAPFRSINVTTLQSRAMLREFHATADGVKEQVGRHLFESATAGRVPDLNAMVDDYWRLRLRRTMHAWKREELPMIVTHDLYDQHDAILNQLRRCELVNRQEDPVKVVYHPDFISATSPLFGIDYDQFVRGCHLGVFPSYYEPWGYTPLESIALGVPALTSDLSGFGSYLAQLREQKDGEGLYVISRRGRAFDDVANQVADRLFEYCQLSRRQRISLRNNVETFSEHFDWKNLARSYDQAHAMALEAVDRR